MVSFLEEAVNGSEDSPSQCLEHISESSRVIGVSFELNLLKLEFNSENNDNTIVSLIQSHGGQTENATMQNKKAFKTRIIICLRKSEIAVEEFQFAMSLKN